VGYLPTWKIWRRTSGKSGRGQIDAPLCDPVERSLAGGALWPKMRAAGSAGRSVML